MESTKKLIMLTDSMLSAVSIDGGVETVDGPVSVINGAVFWTQILQ